MWNNTLWRLFGALTIVVLSATACASDTTATDNTATDNSATDTTDTSISDDDMADMTDDEIADDPSDDHTTTIDVEADATTMEDDPSGVDADVELEVSFVGGEVTVESSDSAIDNGRLDVAAGSVVMVSITSDVADEAHLHGYDVLVEVVPGEPAVMQFTADTPGRFELEFENSGIFIAELSVS